MNSEQIIKETLKTLPSDIRQAIANTDLAGEFKKIAEKHGLLLDQNGSLQTETLLVMIGLRPSSDFVDNLKKNLDISRNEATSIAEDVNKEIFYSIRQSLQQIQLEEHKEDEVEREVQPTLHTEDIEKAGKFTLENPPVGTTQYNEKKIDKEALLNKIQDPEIITADHLLTTPIAETLKVEEKKVESKSYTSDPYRESI